MYENIMLNYDMLLLTDFRPTHFYLARGTFDAINLVFGIQELHFPVITTVFPNRLLKVSSLHHHDGNSN
jgi:hypothetical protein